MINTQTKTITLNYYGTTTNVKTLTSNVQDFLIQNNIVVSNEDIVFPDTNAEIEDNSEIRISSSKEYAKIDIDEIRSQNKPIIAKIEEVIETIPYSEETRNNSSVDRGVTNVVENGSDGQKSIKYLVRYDGDKEIERAKISTDVLVEAKNKVIEVGTKLPLLASRSRLVESVAAEIPTAADGFVAYNIALPVEQQQYAFNICKKYGVQYELLLAIMYKESGFRAGATGVGGAGLCQINPSNYGLLNSALGITNLYDPYDNMTAGAYLLAKYTQIASTRVSGNAIEVYALNAYNMGEGAYYASCFSQGILDRSYSSTVIAIRNSIINNGGI